MAHATKPLRASDTHGCTEHTASTNILRFVSGFSTIRVFQYGPVHIYENGFGVCEQLYNEHKEKNIILRYAAGSKLAPSMSREYMHWIRQHIRTRSTCPNTFKRNKEKTEADDDESYKERLSLEKQKIYSCTSDFVFGFSDQLHSVC